jgi:uncharacterized protein YqhQ
MGNRYWNERKRDKAQEVKMKSSGIGGQAVLEGVMMKNKDKYAIAVRKPDNEIAVEVSEYKGISDKHDIFKMPILRGVAAFADSMIIGVKALTFSSSFFEEEEDKEKKDKKKEGKESKGNDGFFTFITFFLSIVLAVGIFIILPFFLSSLVSKQIDSQIILSIIEGVIRVGLFVGYVVAISQMNDIKRFFQYHGAEHKTINCIEQGYELTVENVRRQSKEHKRCGTSFMLFVMLISIIFFMFIHVDIIWLRYVLRILLIPVVAGVSYEVIRLAGRSNHIIIRVISAPGLWMQRLTTKDPDDSMIEVAIQSVEAVFDWKAYLAENKVGGRNKKATANQQKKGTSLGDKSNYQSKKGNSQENKSNEVQNDKEKHDKEKHDKEKHDKEKHDKDHHQKDKHHKENSSKKLNNNGIVNEEVVKDDKMTISEAVEELAAIEDLANLDKNLYDEQELEIKEKQNQLKEKAKPRHLEAKLSSTEIAASLEPDEEEDDVILKALDRYITFDKEEK